MATASPLPAPSLPRRKKVRPRSMTVFRSFTLPEGDDRWLWLEARSRGVTVAELLRRLVANERGR
jgi:hypothetical protein